MNEKQDEPDEQTTFAMKPCACSWVCREPKSEISNLWTHVKS